MYYTDPLSVLYPRANFPWGGGGQVRVWKNKKNRKGRCRRVQTMLFWKNDHLITKTIRHFV